MKTCILLLIFWAGVLFGQSKETLPQHIIIIKPFGNDSELYSKYKKGSTIKFKIENVNFLKVKGSNIKSEGINFSFNESPLATEKKELGDFSNIDNLTLKKMLKSKSTKKTIKFEVDSLTRRNFEIEYLDFLDALTSLEKAIDLDSALLNIIGKEVFIKDTTWVKRTAENYYNSTYEKGEDIYSKIDSVKQRFFILKTTYNKINHGSRETDKDEYYNEFQYAKGAIAVIEDDTKRKKIIFKAHAGENLYLRIKNESFIYHTEAIQLNEDEVTITPILKTDDEKEIFSFKPIKLKTYSGVQVNFSGGYMLSFIGNDEYAARYNEIGNVIGVKRHEQNKITHALGALAHVFWDDGSAAIYGLSSGVSINTDAKINFYGGVSVAFLEKNRLVFTSGISFVNIKKIDRSNLNDKDEFISPNHSEIKYNDVYKPAPFFGVTYNITK